MNKFLVLGEQRHARDWAHMNRLSPSRWVHVDQRGDRLQGLEGPYRNSDSLLILVQVQFQRDYYDPIVFDLLRAMGFIL